jgi:hypothetical protein
MDRGPRNPQATPAKHFKAMLALLSAPHNRLATSVLAALGPTAPADLSYFRCGRTFPLSSRATAHPRLGRCAREFSVVVQFIDHTTQPPHEHAGAVVGSTLRLYPGHVLNRQLEFSERELTGKRLLPSRHSSTYLPWKPLRPLEQHTGRVDRVGESFGKRLAKWEAYQADSGIDVVAAVRSPGTVRTSSVFDRVHREAPRVPLPPRQQA